MSDAVRDPKRDRFVRLAEKRVTRAVEAIRLVGNLSERSNYRYTQEEARALLSALEQELGATKSRFKASDSKSTRRPFSFEEGS